MKKRTVTALLALLTAAAVMSTACGSAQSGTAAEDTTVSADASDTSSDNTEGEDSTADTGSTSDEDAAAGEPDSDTEGSAEEDSADTAQMVDIDTFDFDDQFTRRDLDASYDEKDAVQVDLKGDAAEADSGGVSVSGSTVTITEAGVYVLRGTLTDGEVIVDAGEDAKVQLVLDGVSIENEDGPAILVKSADKVFLTLAEDSDNTLSDGGKEYTQPDDVDSTVDSVIYSVSDLTIQGSGSLVVDAGYKNGIVSKDDLVITGGDLEIDAEGKGLQANDSVRIGGGTITITSGDDGIHTDKGDKEGKGYVYTEGGTITIQAGDDGIHAETALIINGGTIDITGSYEGLEGSTIDILDGDISVVADDDGLNAASGNAESTGSSFGGGRPGWGWDADENAYIRISGGTLYVNAQGDGIDSNGQLYIDGGTVYVDGPTGSGDGALDVGTSATITGGTVVAAGSSGMAVGFGDDSTQYSVLYYFDSVQAAGTKLTLTDSDGNTVLSYTPSKAYQSVVLSTEDLEEGTYTLTAGDTSDTITIDSISVTAGSTQSRGFGSMGGGPGRGRRQESAGSTGDAPAGDDTGRTPRRPDTDSDSGEAL